MLYSFFSVLRGKVSWTAALDLEYVYKKNKSVAPKMTTGLQNLKKSLDNL